MKFTHTLKTAKCVQCYSLNLVLWQVSLPGDLFEHIKQFFRFILIRVKLEFELFLVLCFTIFLFFFLLFQQLPNLPFQSVYVVFIFEADLLQGADLVPFLCLRLLSLHGLAHTVGDGRLVESLVSEDSHFNFVTDAHKQETSLCAVNSYLADDLVEALGI